MVQSDPNNHGISWHENQSGTSVITKAKINKNAKVDCSAMNDVIEYNIGNTAKLKLHRISNLLHSHFTICDAQCLLQSKYWLCTVWQISWFLAKIHKIVKLFLKYFWRTARRLFIEDYYEMSKNSQKLSKVAKNSQK